MRDRTNRLSPRMFLAAGLACGFLLAAASSSSAQPGFTLTLGQGLNSIAATDPSLGAAARRQTTSGSLEAEHLALDSNLRLYYEFDAGTFSTVGDWKYFLHNGGATYRMPLGESGSNSLYLGASASYRTNGSSWAAADFRALGMMANVEIKPRDTAAIRFGYRADLRSFPDLAELDQLQHDGFVSVLVNLPSRTTLIGETHVGAKSYAATTYHLPASLADAPASLPSGSGSFGRGMGAGALGVGMGPSLRGSLAGSGTTFSESSRAGQVVLFGRVAQSLTDRTGVSLQYLQRSSFGEVPPVVITTPALFFDDGIYDDPFASNARTVSVAGRHFFASGMVIESSVSLMRKDYRGSLALAITGDVLPGEPLREDDVWRAGAGWTLPILGAKTGAFAVDLNLDYYFTRHRSNDAFYNYTSHGVALGLTVGY